jgi:5'(3')-deoxyribonucleotidase
MKTIMVDMDDVLTYGNFSKILEDYLGYRPDYDNIKNYYMQDILGDKKGDFFSKFKDMDMYANATLLPDCYDVLKELSQHYKIYICTDYIWREIVEYAGNNLKNKYNFLYEKLDFINPRNFIFTADKSIVNCDIKIDDRINNIEDAKTMLLFTAWHNKDLSDEELKKQGIIRVNNWKEIREVLKNN